MREAAEPYTSKLFPRGSKRLLATEPLKAMVVGAFVRGLSLRDVVRDAVLPRASPGLSGDPHCSERPRLDGRTMCDGFRDDRPSASKIALSRDSRKGAR